MSTGYTVVYNATGLSHCLFIMTLIGSENITMAMHVKPPFAISNKVLLRVTALEGTVVDSLLEPKRPLHAMPQLWITY